MAVDGHSAAGKSTLAATLAARTHGAVLHMDDFYRDEPDHVRRRHDAAGGVRYYFDWERLVREALLPLRAGNAARFRPFDWDAGGGLGEEVVVDAASVVVLEGVYSAQPEHRPHLDLTVLVDVPEDERTRRRRQRHDPIEWETRWDAAERHYFDNMAAPNTFDLIVSGPW